MIRNENIICISSIDWDFIWQGHQEIMSTLARNGNRVFFIENTGVRTPGIRDISRIRNRIRNWFKGIKGIREEADNLYIYSPLVIPFPYLRIARWINRHLILSVIEKWKKIANFNDPIIWAFLPTPLSLDIIESVSNKIVVYYCIDNFSVSSNSARKIKRYEAKLLKKADLVFVTSKNLYDYCSAYSNRVYSFPFAVNFEEFQKARLENNIASEELRSIPKPIIGYVGGVHKWVDQNLIRIAAQRYPQYSFVFAGPLQASVESLSDLKNIYFLGKIDHNKIPFVIKEFDVCIIPYVDADYTKNVYPTKLNEYHAMGKPIVSTNLPEVVNFNAENNNLVFIAETNEEFIDCIRRALADKDEQVINKRIASARRNSWAIRIEEMSALVQSIILRKTGRPFDWFENFIKIYKAARRRIWNFAALVFCAYLLIAYTPLVWFAASPLKISQPPQKAEAIAVFGGGVGESGRAEQGYEERVQYALELFNKGYARHLIFSSGYMYVFKEPLVMKALAVSLGVPPEAIILEDKAKNTYENVEFTKKILLTNGWNKILIVSSPYHMRRVSLVFRKNAAAINVIYTPIPRSLFYAHGVGPNGRKAWKQINMEQIRGLLHEYIGIIYYWFKGWI